MGGGIRYLPVLIPHMGGRTCNMPDRPRPRADQDKTKQQWRLMARGRRAAVCLLTLGKAAGRHGGNRSRAPIPLPLRHGTFHTYARAAAGRGAAHVALARS